MLFDFFVLVFDAWHLGLSFFVLLFGFAVFVPNCSKSKFSFVSKFYLLFFSCVRCGRSLIIEEFEGHNLHRSFGERESHRRGE